MVERADHILVVAPGFGGGNLPKCAAEYGVTLLTGDELVEEVVEAAVRSERHSLALSDPARPSPERSVRLLGDTLKLLARSRRGLGAAGPSEREFRIPSTSRPGEVNVVSVADGVARCSCTGFTYRGRAPTPPRSTRSSPVGRSAGRRPARRRARRRGGARWGCGRCSRSSSSP